MSLRFKKRFTFYKNAPFDASGVNVCATWSMHEEVLNGYKYVAYGFPDNQASPLRNEYAEMNFIPDQTTLYAPHVAGAAQRNFSGVNYLKVEFFDPIVLGTEQAFATYYYYIMGVDECDVEDDNVTNQAILTWRLSLKMDVWATRVLVGGAQFYGGVLTRAGAITDGLNVSSVDRHSAPVELPFNPNEERIEEKDILPVYETFRAVLQITGKNLRRAVLLISDGALDANTALKSAQSLATSKRLRKVGENVTTLETYNEGEFSVQGAYIVPDYFIVYGGLDTSTRWQSIPENESDFSSYYFYHEVATSLPTLTGTWQKRRLSLNEIAGNSLKQAAAAIAPFPFPRRVSLGTAFSRFDLTEFLHRRDNLPTLDATVETFLGVNSFNIVLTVGNNPPKDITSDFQVFSLVDPENDYIRSNKTNAILSGIGSVGTIAGGVASLASGAGVMAGLGLVASGLTGLTRTIGGFQTAANAPDQLSGAGYGDATAIFGGIYYEVSSYNVSAWARKTKSEGIGRRLTIEGFWSVQLTEEETGKVNVNPLAVAGATVKGIPAGNAQEVAEMLQNGVRVWYNLDALENMEF